MPMFNRENVTRIFAVIPDLRKIFLESPDLEVARARLMGHFNRFIDVKSSSGLFIGGVNYALRLNCVRVFRQFFSRRSARVVGFDMLELFWNMAHEEWDKLPDDLSDAFFEDILHLLLGVVGRSGIYKPLKQPVLKGREAGLARSEDLNEMCNEVDPMIERYLCGLSDSLVARRQKNRKRIQEVFACTDAEFDDFRWQLRHIIRDSHTLESIVELTPEEKQAIDKARVLGLPFGITPYYASLFCAEAGQAEDMPVRAQVIPPMSYVETLNRERVTCPETVDFMRETDTSPIDLITRRYPHIVVFKPYNTCSQICVYCQRNWEIDDVYSSAAFAGEEKIDAAIQWISDNPAISEVLMTGGDPLVMTDKRIRYILEKLAAIKSITRIRIGSRTLVALPQRITDELVDLIASFHVPGRREMAIVTHFEHSYEITPAAMEAVQKFRRKGMSCYNQAVFTIQNCRRFELCALRKWLRLIGVEPYYTFNAKGKEETNFYRLPLARLQQEAKEEARLMPGLTRTDEPVYNVPGLGKNYLRAEQNHLLLSIMPDGRRVYEFHPWEKFISSSRAYVHYDIPIYSFLQKLAAMGENIEDYKGIYYYF